MSIIKMGQPIAKVKVQYNDLQICKTTQIVCKEDVHVILQEKDFKSTSSNVFAFDMSHFSSQGSRDI